MKIKKLLAIVLAVLMVLSSTAISLAFDYASNENGLLISPNPYIAKDDTITVVLNDQLIDFTDENGNVVNPQIINSRTMVPMRKIFEVFGAEIEWDGDTQTVTAKTDEKELTLQINNNKAKVRTIYGEEMIELDSAPVIIDGRTLVPVRFIAESLELRVGWDPDLRMVVILDTAPLYETIKKEAPTFYEFITTEFVNTRTGEATVDGNLTVDYKNTDDKKSNTNIALAIKGDSKVSEEAVSVDVNVKTTGKGSLLDAVKEVSLDKFDLSMIVDRNDYTTYIKSTLLESEYGSKWVKMPMTDEDKEIINDAITMAEMSETTTYIDSVEFLLDAIDVTPTTYYELEEVIEILCKFVNDTHFKVSGRTSKTYTYELSLEDVLDIVNFDMTTTQKRAFLSMYNGKISISFKVEDNTVKSTKLGLDANIKVDDETVIVGFEMESTLTSSNKSVTIKMPSAREVVELD